ncbi:hypothetical protein D3C72_2083200 [compost metagenome]
MARPGLQGADQQEYQQQRADQAQADHQRHGQFGIGQDHRADHEHHDPAQTDHAVVGQGRLGDQERDTEGDQPDPRGVGSGQSGGVRGDGGSA